MKVAYVVSRFPHVSETFIVRELDAVEEQEGVEIELFSLFPPVDPTVHPAAEPWVERLHRATPARGATALLRWLRRRPGRLLSSVALVVRGYGRRPAMLARALATLPAAAEHAESIERGGVDRVHAHYATYPALAAWFVRRLTGIPYSITAHAHDLYVDQSFLARKVGEAEFVVPISDFNRRFLEPYRPRAAPVVHCGIDPGAYPFRERELDPTRRIRGLCVASLQEYKGHGVLLRALRSGPDRLSLDLVGSGALRAELESLVRELELEDRVKFHGSLPEQEVARLMGEADLFVLASIVAADGQMEGLPVVLMEALASGAPVVTTRLSGIPEIVRHGETGLLAEPGDPRGLARALEGVLADPEGARARARAGRELVEAEFDIHRSGERMAQLFSGTG